MCGWKSCDNFKENGYPVQDLRKAKVDTNKHKLQRVVQNYICAQTWDNLDGYISIRPRMRPLFQLRIGDYGPVHIGLLYFKHYLYELTFFLFS